VYSSFDLKKETTMSHRLTLFVLLACLWIASPAFASTIAEVAAQTLGTDATVDLAVILSTTDLTPYQATRPKTNGHVALARRGGQGKYPQFSRETLTVCEKTFLFSSEKLAISGDTEPIASGPDRPPT
jgi:hypothetical protein